MDGCAKVVKNRLRKVSLLLDVDGNSGIRFWHVYALFMRCDGVKHKTGLAHTATLDYNLRVQLTADE